jgi:hypothetical protein
MKAYSVLKPSSSKRLIAKGVASVPIVREALARGTIVVTLGTTNAYVAEELLRRPIDRGAFAAGVIDDRWNLSARLGETTDLVLVQGEAVSLDSERLLKSLGSGDILIKGGNAIDPWGVVGVLLGASTGGTVGRYVPTALARGVKVVIPISVAKAVHTAIRDLSIELGSRRLALGDGLPCGMFPLTGQVVSEIEALESLFGVRALHVASGGVGPGRGSVSLLIEGEERDVRAAYALLHSLKNEPDENVEGRR